MQTRRLSLLMAILIVLSLLPHLAMPAQAAYENTYKNTGDQRADIVGVALTQVGYREGSGNNNKNKYSEYFGYGARAWCGDFVSWCARQANIPKSVLKNSGPAKPSTFGITTVHKSGYTPKPGDLFFKTNYGHVGIVYYVSGSYFYTIEGNTWDSSPRKDGVYIRKRKISEFYFGVPKYDGESSSSGSSSCDHNFKTDYDSAHPHKEYKLCTKCSYKTYTGKDRTVDSCKTCQQEGCTHKYSDWTKSSSTKHKKTCSLCGKTVSESHSWGESIVTTEPTCTKTGVKTKTCKYCTAEKTEKIKATGEHAIDDVVYIDDKYHGQTCEDCGKVIKSKHKITKEYAADGKNHWHYCEECGERYELGEHAYVNGCASECKTCKYISPFTHDLPDEYSCDEINHWKVCKECNLPIESAAHDYTSDCDAMCNTCGFVRTALAEHTLSSLNDEDNHWQECSTCKEIIGKAEHTPDANAKDWEDMCCTGCGLVLRSGDLHVHTYESIDYNRRMHWGTCACGEEMPQEGHRFSMETKKCSVCNVESSPVGMGAQLENDWILMIGVGAFGGIIIVMLLILFIRRVKRKRIY